MTTIYRYGLMAWFWRMLIAAGLVGGGALMALGVRMSSVALVLSGTALFAPALFFGLVVAVNVAIDGDVVCVGTLLFWRRRVPRAAIRPPRVREHYHAEYGRMYAPRVWVRVPRALPVYIDLLGQIVDRPAFLAAFQLSGSSVPRATVPPARGSRETP